MHIIWWIAGTLGALLVVYMAYTVYLASVLRWEDARTVGLAYYGLPPAGREQFKQELRRKARILSPILRLNARLTKLDLRRARIEYKGVAAPAGSCSVDSFARADGYLPRPEDVFVVTQMKCGTTWMLHVVYEVLRRGQGDLVATGTTLHAVCPWLEGRRTIPLDEAPLVGAERRCRIIKTHLPAGLCPFSRDARYIYVARHPVSCFASCVDFVRTNVGEMAPGLDAFEAWYTSPDMWWGTWTDHVKGWWARRSEPNVLFVYFEDMKRDLPAIVRRVADFLGMQPLTDAEVAEVARKCSFQYMQEHDGAFEMHPPHLLQTNADLFVRGAANRHEDVPEATRKRLAGWVVREMTGSDFPLERAYPDVMQDGR